MLVSELKAHLFIQNKNQSTLIPVYFEMWSGTRGVMNSVIHTLKLYRTVFIKKKILFHNLTNYNCSYRWRSRNIFFSTTTEAINLIFALLEWRESPPSIFTTCNFRTFVRPRGKHENLIWWIIWCSTGSRIVVLQIYNVNLLCIGK